MPEEVAEAEAPAASERLVLWRAKEPMTDSAATEIAAELSAHVVGEAALDTWAGRTFGCALVDADVPNVDFGAIDVAALPFPAPAVVTSAAADPKASWETFGQLLPAPPLALKTKQPVHQGFHLEFVFSEELEEHERAALSDLFSLFEAAYLSDEQDIAIVEESVAAKSASLRLSTSLVDDDTVRAHAYWLIEVIDRFWPLARADFRGRAAPAKKGLRPTWLGPVVTMGAALAFARFGNGPDAVRSSMLALLFLPLVFTFLSRTFVTKATWAAAAFNALGVAALTAITTNPSLVWPMPESPSAEFLAEVQGNVVACVYIARGLCLVWALPYLRSGRR